MKMRQCFPYMTAYYHYPHERDEKSLNVRFSIESIINGQQVPFEGQKQKDNCAQLISTPCNRGDSLYAPRFYWIRAILGLDLFVLLFKLNTDGTSQPIIADIYNGPFQWYITSGNGTDGSVYLIHLSWFWSLQLVLQITFYMFYFITVLFLDT